MGAAGSSAKGSTSDPFPVDKGLSKRLDYLSFVAARILSTPDIYDINNLARPGVCGDYAVFLKKDLEKKLLPFVVDISGVPTEVVYQNPRKSISDLEVRKKICGKMVDSMLRAIATVIACLASIQVAAPSREAAVASVPKQAGGSQTNDLGQVGGSQTNLQTNDLLTQVGGSVVSVRDWLVRTGYIPALAVKSAGQPMDFQIPGNVSARYKFKLTLERTEGNVTYGFISAESTDGRETLPSGSLRVQFLNEVSLPIPGQAKTILPMRIVDNAGLPWVAGILYESVFKSFVETTSQYHITDIIVQLFKKTQGAEGALPETRQQITQANEIFQQYKKTQNPQVIVQALTRWFSEHIQGFQAGYVPQAQAYAPYAPYAPYGQPYGQAYAQPYGQQPQPYGVQGIKPLAPIPPKIDIGAVALRQGMEYSYDIPLPATTKILNTLKVYRDLIPKQSSPAAVRANTLAALVNRDRTIQTGVCRDPYFSEPILSKIYPWATFQFLCTEDWKKLTDDKTQTKFATPWTRFITTLSTEIYTTAPKLDRGTMDFLEQMKFSKVGDIRVCKNTQNPRVKFNEVQEALSAIQNRYQQHVTAMWAVLNELILVIQDPETKADTVRLHPNVVKMDGKSSFEYVADKASKAQELLGAFYTDIERIYATAIASMVEVPV